MAEQVSSGPLKISDSLERWRSHLSRLSLSPPMRGLGPKSGRAPKRFVCWVSARRKRPGCRGLSPAKLYGVLPLILSQDLARSEVEKVVVDSCGDVGRRRRFWSDLTLNCDFRPQDDVGSARLILAKSSGMGTLCGTDGKISTLARHVRPLGAQTLAKYGRNGRKLKIWP